jgi:hypothetical protein
MHVFSFLFLIITSVLFAITSLCVPLDAITLPHLHIHILVWACVCARVRACVTIFVSFDG